MANNLGSLVVSLGLDAAQFTSGMTKAEYQAYQATEKIKGQLQSLGKYVAGLGLGAAFVQSIRSTADYADEMGKLAQRAGVTTEAISGLAYAAKLSDVDNQTLAKGLRVLAIDAESGGEKLSAMGIALADAGGKAKTSDKLFLDVADRLSSIEDPGRRAAEAAKIFGDRIGPEMLPLLTSGRDGIKLMTDEAARFGRIVSDEAGAKAAEFNDNLTRLSESSAGLVQRLSGPLVSSLADASSYFIKVANDVGVARASLITFGAALARATGLDDVGRLSSQAKANSNAVALTVKQIETFQRLADAGDAGAASRVAQLRQQFEKLQVEGQKITSTLKQEAASIESSFTPVKGAPLETGPRPSSSSGGGGRAVGASRAKAADPDAAFNSYLSNLRRQFEAAQSLGVVETTLRDIQLGRLGSVDEAQRQTLLTVATQIEQAQRGKQLAIEQADADKQAADAKAILQEAGAKLFEETRTAQEQLIARLAEIDRLQQAGAISAETAGRASAAAAKLAAAGAAELTDEQKKAKALAGQFQGAFAAAATDVIFNSANASDAVRALGIEIAKIIIQQQVIKPLAEGGGNLLASFLTGVSFDGGGYTGYGARSGGVDGKGGFPAILHPNETVIDHTRGGGMGGVTVVQNVTIDARGADAGVEARIQAAMRQAKTEAVAEVQSRAGRGGSFSASLGRA